ncbi:MAG: SpoIIE family protein phosphatase, partial [Synechocystis sp.]|nr:SpoIIE family protein phosphatase [Synechocystis sp.]
VNQLLMTDADRQGDALAFQERLANVPAVMATPTQAVVTGVDNLFQKGLDPDFTADIEKVREAAIALDHLIHHLDTLCQDFQSYTTTEMPASSMGTDSADSDAGFPQETETLEPESSALIGHILVVDDNQTNLDLLERQLIRKGHHVTTCLNTQLALENLQQSAFDIILLDLIMPETNGYEFLKFLKGSPDFQFIPVIMISALDDFQNIVQCIKVGAEDYLPKPFDPILLKARIDASLERKKLRDKEVLYTQQVEMLSALMQKELDKGRQMQKNFLPPKNLSKPGWEFESFFSPAKQLAGDFYDMFELPNNAVGIVIADVCDKGVGAALFMGLFRSLIRIFSGQTLLDGLRVETQGSVPVGTEGSPLNDDHILKAIALANNYVAINHGDTGMFATIFFGVLNLDTGKMSYVNGGHEPVFILDANHQIKQTLKSTGPAVGMLPDLPFKVQETTLGVGDSLFAYTDGVPEAKSITGEFFGAQRLQDLLVQPCTSAKVLTQTITNAVIEHIGEADQFDDITVVALKHGSGADGV